MKTKHKTNTQSSNQSIRSVNKPLITIMFAVCYYYYLLTILETICRFLHKFYIRKSFEESRISQKDKGQSFYADIYPDS